MSLRSLLPLLFLAACGGGDDSDTGTSTGDDDDDTTSPDDCSLPTYDLEGLSCAQLGTAWETTVKAGNSCSVAADCVALRAECEHWPEVTCYYAVNKTCIQPALLTQFNQAAASCANDDVCACVPASADCVGGECVVISD